MNQVDVSIVVPLYNKKDKIETCLKSLMQQSITNIEIVVVDDGSKDGGADIVKEYQMHEPRIKLIIQENRGPGAARNAGIRKSTGKYIGFVDCDDFVEKHMYQSMFDALEKNKVAVAVCQEKNLYIQDGKYKEINETKFPFDEVKKIDGTVVLDWFLNYKYLSLNSACFKLIRRDMFFDKEIWFPEQRFVEDIVLSGAVLSASDSIIVVPESFYMYVHEMGTRSTSFSIKKAEDILKNMKDIRNYIEKYRPSTKLDNFILGMCFSSMRQLYGALWKEKAKNRKVDAKKLIIEWRKMKKGVAPSLRKSGMPALHKIKILAAWLNMEKVACKVLGVLADIPFFKYMS